MERECSNWELLTDLYELTKAAAYFDHGMFEPATFSLFIREYPSDRAYFVNAGLEDALAYLASISQKTIWRVWNPGAFFLRIFWTTCEISTSPEMCMPLLKAFSSLRTHRTILDEINGR